MKDKFLILILILSFSIPISLAQTTEPSKLLSINLPFIGEITIVGGVAGLVAFFMGYMVGSGLKAGIKYAVILFIFILALYLTGVISKDVIVKISDVIAALKPLVDTLEEQFRMGNGATNFQVLMFFVGLGIGMWKG